jgi:hypothetical protein
MQPTYKDLAELALICARHSRLAENESVANELWRLAKDYQESAKLDHGACRILATHLTHVHEIPSGRVQIGAGISNAVLGDFNDLLGNQMSSWVIMHRETQSHANTLQCN